MAQPESTHTAYASHAPQPWHISSLVRISKAVKGYYSRKGQVDNIDYVGVYTEEDGTGVIEVEREVDGVPLRDTWKWTLNPNFRKRRDREHPIDGWIDNNEYTWVLVLADETLPE